jgi:hypothetical protein
MANKYFRNTGNTDWWTPTNWANSDGGPSSGLVPNSSDTVYMTANSGNCIVNSPANSWHLDARGYTRTLTLNAVWTLGGCILVFDLPGPKMVCNGGYIEAQGIPVTAFFGYTIPLLSIAPSPTTQPITLNDTLRASTLRLVGTTAKFEGVAGFIVGEVVFQTAGSTLSLLSGNNYVVKGRLTSMISTGTHTKIIASATPTKAILTCTGPASLNNTDFTDIDNSAGRTLYSWGGVITNSLNINTLTEYIPPVNTTVSGCMFLGII